MDKKGIIKKAIGKGGCHGKGGVISGAISGLSNLMSRGEVAKQQRIGAVADATRGAALFNRAAGIPMNPFKSTSVPAPTKVLPLRVAPNQFPKLKTTLPPIKPVQEIRGRGWGEPGGLGSEIKRPGGLGSEIKKSMQKRVRK